jgi:uncharacterized membrane protein
VTAAVADDHDVATAHRRGAALLVGIVLAGAALRVWGIFHDPLTWDEAFTGSSARRPVGELFAFLRTHDAHPPLDYLLRVPIARLTSAEWALRVPSAACSIAALVALAVWLRRRPIAAPATAVFALTSFQLTHAWTARMYAPLVLVGVLLAWTVERWTQRPRDRDAVAAGALITVALFLHASTLLFVPGLVTVAGTRRDRDAWRWRAAVATPLVAWAVLWGPSFMSQRRADTASWIPRTTPSWFAETVGSLVAYVPAAGIVIVAGIVTGALLLRRSQPSLWRVTLAMFVLPATALAVVGVDEHVLIGRALALGSFVPALCLGELVVVLATTPVRRAVAAAVAVAILVPSLHYTFDQRHPSGGWYPAVAWLADHADATDGVGAMPAALAVAPRWYAMAPSARPTAVDAPAGTEAVAPGSTTARRLWLLTWSGTSLPDGWEDCAAPYDDGTYRVVCVVRRPR